MASETDRIKEITGKMDGWLAEGEGLLLYNLAKKCSKGVIVEIGSWKGKSTIWLASGSKKGKNARVYAIDPHIGSPEHQKMFGKVWTFEEFKKNIKRAGVDDIIVPMVKKSEDAAKNFSKPVGLAFIDGDHEYDMVKLDYDLWFPKLVEGGVMAFHDTILRPGPAKIVEEKLCKSSRFKDIGFIGSITYGTKVRQNSFMDRLRGRYVIFLRRVYSFANHFHSLPAPVKRIGKKAIRAAQ
jgi:predicted O-methyltransferase YrrM